MKLELVRDGNVFRPVSGILPREAPERIEVELPPAGAKRTVAELWGVAIGPDAARRLQEALERQEGHGH
jgi:hypothetical protein